MQVNISIKDNLLSSFYEHRSLCFLSAPIYNTHHTALSLESTLPSKPRYRASRTLATPYLFYYFGLPGSYSRHPEALEGPILISRWSPPLL